MRPRCTSGRSSQGRPHCRTPGYTGSPHCMCTCRCRFWLRYTSRLCRAARTLVRLGTAFGLRTHTSERVVSTRCGGKTVARKRRACRWARVRHRKATAGDAEGERRVQGWKLGSRLGGIVPRIGPSAATASAIQGSERRAIGLARPRVTRLCLGEVLLLHFRLRLPRASSAH